MTIYRLTILFICILTFACNNKSEKINAVRNTPIFRTINKDNSCKCFDGIGSKKGDIATLILNFTDGQSISVCGFVDQEMEGIIVSEFNVFECSTGNSLTAYDATQICRLVEKKDSLIIQEMKYLPTGENWDWNLIQIGEEIITTKEKRIITTGNNPKLEKFTINENAAKIFLHSLKKRKGHSDKWELEIGKLEVLTLLGNEQAKYILENYEEFIGKKTDGAERETWKDSKATIEWIKQ